MTVPRHLSLIYRLQDDVFSLQPRALVTLISTNDLGERTLPVQIAANAHMLHGRMGAAFLKVALKRKWLVQNFDSRILSATSKGRGELAARFRLRW